MTDPILITGCSSGMGREAARALLERGHTVYATARRPETLAELKAKGAHVLALDVTDIESMRAAVAAVEAEHGAVGTLINNAGYSQPGPIETVPVAKARAQYETNVFGLTQMCQLVLPAMRAKGSGRIINVGSMGGRMTLPVNGWYHSTKYAIESLSDALRMEVRPFGIDVVIIEPGAIKTEFDTTAGMGVGIDMDSPYAELEVTNGQVFSGAYGKAAASAEYGAKTYVKAVEARHPRHRYLNTASGRVVVYARHFLGSQFWDAAVGRAYRWR
ncbi:SDR family NAD(P)-dependent oxidoreductase [Demequina oxidasica]|uniref:SDR family NAD(P)-dependent oxidoreductase n=1 Tax=Demequina oxidasica TaxID=676199 RepID=UPI000784C7D9|nr:SDR family NAD(P)-dependent oxidoreductase [Demequina oxidasica]